MAPTKQLKYEFKTESLIEIRKKIRITQRKMAELLGVPPNTLSRWEKGTTVPDAKSLASIYSIAIENGVIPSLFGIRGGAKTPQYNLIVLWDFQSMGTPARWVAHAHSTIMMDLLRRFAGMPVLKTAFTHPAQKDAAEELTKLGWRIWEGKGEKYDEIIRQARSDSELPSDGTALVLISKDERFVKLIDELKKKGTQVFVISRQTFNNKLFGKVGRENSIPWRPLAADELSGEIGQENSIPWHPLAMDEPERQIEDGP